MHKVIIVPRNSFASLLEVNEEVKTSIRESKIVVINSIGQMGYIDQLEKNKSGEFGVDSKLEREGVRCPC